MSFDYNANLHRPTSILACNPLFANICFLGTLNPSVVGLRRNLVVLLVLHIIPMGGGGTAVEQGDHPIEALFLGRNIVHMPSVNTNSWGKMMSCDVSIETNVAFTPRCLWHCPLGRISATSKKYSHHHWCSAAGAADNYVRSCDCWCSAAGGAGFFWAGAVGGVRYCWL